AALDVDGAEDLAEFQVVLGLEALGAEVADGAVRLQRDEVLLAADGDVGVDEVAELQQEFLGLGVGGVPFGVGGLHRGGELARLLQQLGLLVARSEEHTSELQSRENLVCRLLLEKKKQQ